MIDTAREGPILIAGLSGRIDGTNARQVQTELESALGDDDRRTLYMVTAPTSRPPADSPALGRIERVRVDVAGAGLP